MLKFLSRRLCRYLSLMKISLYIHIPFCVRKCLYCDFNSGPYDNKVRSSYIDALIKEIEAEAPEYSEYEVISIFFGGGTPSLLTEDEFNSIFSAIENGFNLSKECEITLEVNPGTVCAENCEKPFFHFRGINRVSIGLQSSVDEELKKLGRIHTLADFENTYRIIRNSGIENVSVDIMSAIPGQTFESYIKTLEYVVSLTPPPEHISSYSLIIEEGTPFYDMYSENSKDLPDEETERMMYQKTGEYLAAMGYSRYEISNYSKKGFESRHNSVYWERGNYVGFGLGAASMVNNARWKNDDDIYHFCENPFLHSDYRELSVGEQMEEFMFLGLRMMKGISVSHFEDIFNCPFPDQFNAVVDKYISTGHMKVFENAKKRDRIMLTEEGINVSNVILSEFLFDKPLIF